MLIGVSGDRNRRVLPKGVKAWSGVIEDGVALKARSRRGRSPRPTSSLPRAAKQLLRLSAESQASGARPPPGDKVAVF